ncbi:hypothetical protein EYR40_006337 [Pleurotus pulmonarius]|nr:hypothetical protein EYR36_010958 [Pleurotus pulmonarius]KAF4599246.1 hypothetical protein EYR40_006337 [Pleurotus pulmonarius]
MAFILARPPSPGAREIDPEEWALSSAFHAVPFHSSSTPAASTSQLSQHLQDPLPQSPHESHTSNNMSKEKERQRVDIVLDSDCLYLKGTGVDVEPALLSGHVILYLAESTPIKEITLQFRGKARLPVPPGESISLNNSPHNYILCNHEWSFLEGEKKHSHRLKAGRHVFPFQLQIGGSLPSSISTNAGGGANIVYKLRAHVVRPGFTFSHNLQTVVPVSVIRAFTAEALEYQQTLEIENTWPEKLMYSIMLPHKAWAAGDRIAAVVKFSPLAKGVRILSITSTIHETTKLYGRSGHQESTNPVCSIIHEMVGGVAVEVTREQMRRRSRSSTSPGASSPFYPSTPSSSGMRTPPTRDQQVASSANSFSMTPISSRDGLAMSVQSSGQPSSSSSSTRSSPHASTSFTLPGDTSSTFQYDSEENNTMQEITTVLYIPISASTVTPTHPLDPIIVSHRLRWSILIHNLDGHTSELRCSLPIHVLDSRLLAEARQNTAATRRLLLGNNSAFGSDPDGVDPAMMLENEEDTELPSYYSHVRDRVANMFLPETATMRVTNPWVLHGVSPVVSGAPHTNGTYTTTMLSGTESPLDAPHHTVSALSQLPPAPVVGESTPLDWVNSELLLSLSGVAPQGASTTPPSVNPSNNSDPSITRNGYPFPDTRTRGGVVVDGSIPTSRISTRPNTRPSTRPPSPERQLNGHGNHHLPATANETYVHAGAASRQLNTLTSISMKPLTSLTHHSWLPSRSSSHTNLASLTPLTEVSTHSYLPFRQQSSSHSSLPSTTSPNNAPGHTHSPVTSIPLPDAEIGSALLHRAFTEVPDYSVASRGFLGGVPPLSSMQGLPSYEEASHRSSPTMGTQRDLVGTAT